MRPDRGSSARDLVSARPDHLELDHMSEGPARRSAELELVHRSVAAAGFVGPARRSVRPDQGSAGLVHGSVGPRPTRWLAPWLEEVAEGQIDPEDEIVSRDEIVDAMTTLLI